MVLCEGECGQRWHLVSVLVTRRLSHSPGLNSTTGIISKMQNEEEDHSILEDDSDNEGDDHDEFMDEDDSSSLSVPNESIDFDLVYSLHTFVATVDGQANVVKGDSLFLMDDSNSYWWLVRVLKTQEVGYIPAENIETPYERLARLNKHRNVDVRLPPLLHILSIALILNPTACGCFTGRADP